MRNLLLSLVFATSALTAVAHADTVPTSYTYDFTGIADGTSGTGTITSDASGKVTAANITFSATSSGGFADMFTRVTYFHLYGDGGTETDFANGSGTFSLTTSDPFSRTVAPTIQLSSSYVVLPPKSLYLTAGSLTLEQPVIAAPPVSTAATPEPSSLILLGTGALGMAGAVRRRFLARA